MILLDVGFTAWSLDRWKSELWEKCGIGVPWFDREANDAVLFGFLTAWLLGEVCSVVFVYLLIFVITGSFYFVFSVEVLEILLLSFIKFLFSFNLFLILF